MARLEVNIASIIPIKTIIRQVQADTFDFIVEDDALHCELNLLGIAIEE